MAKLHDDEITRVSFPITKFEEDADGNLVVEGTVTDGSVDTDEQIVDPKFSAKALKEWMESGPNVRVMHSPHLLPAGRGLKVELGDFSHTLKALVVEDTAKKLVKNQVLRAYSVGISRPVIERDVTGKARGGIITGGELCEVSLVDRPANRSCQLTLAKSEDHDVPWAYGDLDDLLTKAEAASEVKADNATTGADAPDASPGPFAQWQAARKAWLGTEPSRGGAADGTEYLAKRAAWQKWNAQGEEDGLTEDGFPLWLAKSELSAADRDKLGDSDFAYVDSKGEGHLPVHDEGHVRSALGRFNQQQFEDDSAKKKAAKKILARAKEMGIDVDEDSAVAQAAKISKAAKPRQCADCNTFNDADATQCSNCGHDLGETRDHQHGTAAKGQKDCPKCGAGYDADSKKRRCEQCGKKLPKAGAVAEKAKKPKRMLPADVKPAGEHREPDGSSTVEQLEPQAGMGTDTDPVKDKVPPSVETKAEAPYSVTRMHDALCAAYHQDAVVDAYPALKSVADAVDADWWQAQVAETAVKGDLDAVGYLVDVARAATALKGEDTAVLADARAELHKGFVDLHGKSMTPGSVTPGQFQRPYISGGHAPLSARPGQTPRVPPGTHTPDPGQFDRDTLTAGHATPSPGDTGDNNPTASTATGASRRYYTTAARDAARNAMQAMHDHIADTFPDMCPMAASKTVLPPDMGDSSRPRPVQAPDVPKAPGEKAAQPKVKKHKKAKTKAETSAPVLDPDLIKSIVTEATAAITANYETQITALKAEIDGLGRQPDPTQAPVRGVVRTKAATTAPAPVERRNLAAEAQEKAVKAEQRAYIDYLMKCAASGDPNLREKALAVLDGAGIVPQLPTP